MLFNSFYSNFIMERVAVIIYVVTVIHSFTFLSLKANEPNKKKQSCYRESSECKMLCPENSLVGEYLLT